MVEIYKVKSEAEMKLVRDIRIEVFVEEQGVPVELEMDEFDNEAIHVLAYIDGVPAGCGRLLLKGEEAKIGRVAVRKSMRRNAIGTGICKLLISIDGDHGIHRVYLGAQLTAVEFYASMGFTKEGEVFTEAGIEHIKMVKSI
jgi:predicted GNAT family N-acyltransferase